MHGVVYLEITLRGQAPAALDHHFEYRVDDGSGSSGAVDGGHVRVDGRPLPVLGPPLRGGLWVAIHSPTWARGHRRLLYTIDRSEEHTSELQSLMRFSYAVFCLQ